MNLDENLRTMLRERTEGVAAAPVVPDSTLRRVRMRKVLQAGGAVAVVATVAVMSALVLRSAVWSDAAPVPPAEREEREGPPPDPMRNGRIVQADRGYWPDYDAPPPPGGKQSFAWDAFDQDTGSFLYTAQSLEGRVWVVGEDGLVAQLDCPPSSGCGRNEMDTFGPGPDEISATDGRSVHVIGFDATLRDTLDISAVWGSQGQDVSDIAWSPDGNRLAVSTEPEFSTQPERGCHRSSGPCGGTVWIFNRDGGEPQLVYTKRASEASLARDLAWSPDGDTLALLVAPPLRGCGDTDAWPRLVALRVAPDEPVRAETLNVYDDLRSEMGCLLPEHYRLAFPFAWSPDGTRIAVTSGDGIAEISSENGEVLARHPGEGAEGPLAWLPKALTSP